MGTTVDEIFTGGVGDVNIGVAGLSSIINPLAAIGALQLLLENLGEDAAAADVERGIVKTVAKMPSMSAGQMDMSTSEVGDSVANNI